MKLDLPTLAEQSAAWAGKPQPKGASRLQEAKAEKKLTLVDEKAFKKAVWDFAGGCCQKCGRKVFKMIARVKERGEVHHIHGRMGDLRFEARCAILACVDCHEQLTGRVNEKYIVVPTKTWTLPNGEVVTDARAKLKFRRIV